MKWIVLVAFPTRRTGFRCLQDSSDEVDRSCCLSNPASSPTTPPTPSGDAESLSILFLGNSYTFYNNLPVLVAGFGAAANSPKLLISFNSVTPGGSSLWSKSSMPEVRDLLTSQSWDIVVLQDQSLTPAASNPTDYERALDSLEEFYAPLIMQANAKALLYQTWGRRDGDSQLGSFLEMSQETATGYRNYAEILQAQLGNRAVDISQVGAAFEVIHDTSTSSNFRNLYDPDGSHPSLEGSYLAAACFYTTITGTDPRGVPYRPSGLTDSDVERLQTAAAGACL
eukprot:CAMPEP_0194195314 /NCGR_PEP_ID=MMETSP0154-20130528/76067_1 /TAXON_ID=1049557 /ORGANISM="Thalassiothrix antarctica, Strain L6-D1" /LENGTH=282 /DNA_ID=CAMNT_0038919833 /DNA_START=1125 /DNA_END=1973 /DNA_ORIENTATION=-